MLLFPQAGESCVLHIVCVCQKKNAKHMKLCCVLSVCHLRLMSDVLPVILCMNLLSFTCSFAISYAFKHFANVLFLILYERERETHRETTYFTFLIHFEIDCMDVCVFFVCMNKSAESVSVCFCFMFRSSLLFQTLD